MENHIQHLFQPENDWIVRSQCVLHSSKGMVTAEEYESLLHAYQKLFRWTTKIFSISDKQALSLKQREAELRHLLDQTGQGFLLFGEDLCVQKEYSAECARLFGRRIAGLSVAELLFQDEAAERAKFIGAVGAWLGRPDDKAADLPAPSLAGRTLVHGRSVEWRVKPLQLEAGESPMMMMVLTDITEKVNAEARLRALSSVDKLTGLYNRAYAEQWLSDMTEREDLFPFSLLYADVNGLKLLNDVFGHEEGDRLLLRAVRMLQDAAEPRHTAVRWGGDELLLLMPQTGEREAQAIAARLETLCSQSEAAPIRLSVAVGTATAAEWQAEWRPLLLLAEKRMYKAKLFASRGVYDQMLEDLIRLQHRKLLSDEETTMRLGRMTWRLAQAAGLEGQAHDELTLIRLATIHNLGMVSLPEQLLHKSEPLSEQEWELVRTHSDIGYRLARALGEPMLAEAVLSVHEHWNGGGYPFGLKQEEIPLPSRLLAIVDAFEAMTRQRAFRPALSRSAALEEIGRCAGTQFDPRLAATFAQESSRIIL